MLYDLRHEHAYFVQWLILYSIGNWSKHFVKLLSCAMSNSMKKKKKTTGKHICLRYTTVSVAFDFIQFDLFALNWLSFNSMQFTAVSMCDWQTHWQYQSVRLIYECDLLSRIFSNQRFYAKFIETCHSVNLIGSKRLFYENSLHSKMCGKNHKKH